MSQNPVTGGHVYNTAMGYLRGFVIFLVVLHHSIVGYMPGVPAPAHGFAGGMMLWRAFPVLDPARWAPASLIAGINDNYFMALMFLLSGLFVSPSLSRKGVGAYLRERVLRLGIPFLFCAGIIMPIAYYTAYLQSGGVPGIAPYWQAWNAIGYWPTGPAWFVLLLLVFDFVVAALFAAMPNWTSWPAKIAARAREHPARLFWILVGLSFLAYAPLAIAYGSVGWTYFGLLQFQTSRVLHYFLYFLVGIAIGAAGLESGLVAEGGKLARRWWMWLLWMVATFVIGTAMLLAIMGAKGQAQQTLIDIGSFTFVLSCAASCFALLAIFSRFARTPNRAWRSLADNSYGIYLLHYAFVAWSQYALLSAPLPGGVKAVIVVVVALALSWSLVALLRRIPLIARIV